MEPVRLIVIGAGCRGTDYAAYALQHPDQAKIVGVAEPRSYYRKHLVEKHQIQPQNVFLDWKDVAKRERFADAVIIATQDAMHTEPAEAFAEKGYHILLEKPMAPTEAECRRIIKAVIKNKVLFGVCHVLRYTPYTQKVKAMIDAGAIGELVGIQLLEPVGYWHFAHSFVRGNWRNEGLSTFILMAKSCHDLDWLRYIVGSKCQKVSSFGTLKHFRKDEKPANASDRCLDCRYEPECVYSAKKIYLGRVERGEIDWPVDVLTPVVTKESIESALRDGLYGRCVYSCDNDVMDNQVVNMQFEKGRTASFTLSAFTKAGMRRATIFGTKGELYTDGNQIKYTNFMTDTTEIIDVKVPDDFLLHAQVLQSHGGGDYALMKSFVAAVAQNDQSLILSGPEETLESHLMVFAAEQARRENRVINL